MDLSDLGSSTFTDPIDAAPTLHKAGIAFVDTILLCFEGCDPGQVALVCHALEDSKIEIGKALEAKRPPPVRASEPKPATHAR